MPTIDRLVPSQLDTMQQACTCILEAIKAGSKGGTIIQADVGNHDKQLRARYYSVTKPNLK